jgi:hypothetical protein
MDVVHSAASQPCHGVKTCFYLCLYTLRSDRGLGYGSVEATKEVKDEEVSDVIMNLWKEAGI